MNDDAVWELHTWESDVFMWRAARDWVLKSVRVHGMHTSPSSRKQHRNTGADKREKVLIAREFLESLPRCPHTIAERIRWNCTLKLWLLHAHICAKCFKSTAIPKENSEFYSRKWRCKTLLYTNPQNDQRSVCLGHKYGTVSEQDFREHEKRKEESRQKKKNDK